jgi:hypothetical protein
VNNRHRGPGRAVQVPFDAKNRIFDMNNRHRRPGRAVQVLFDMNNRIFDVNNRHRGAGMRQARVAQGGHGRVGAARCPSGRWAAPQTNGIHLVLFDTNNRILGPCLASRFLARTCGCHLGITETNRITWSCSACRTRHLVPILWPCVGPSVQYCCVLRLPPRRQSGGACGPLTEPHVSEINRMQLSRIGRQHTTFRH